MIQKQLEEIEQKLMDIYAEIKKEIPAVNCLDFAVSQINENSEPYLYGFLHIGPECKPINNIAELSMFITEEKERRAKNEILFQQFGKIE